MSRSTAGEFYAAPRRRGVGSTEQTRPRFFESGEEFRAWLGRHHDDVAELWVGFHKRGSGRPSMTWSESVDQSLCFGWIDGVRRSVDASAYMIRFTPRRAASRWSQKNLARFDELRRLGLVRPEGEAAFAARGETVVAWYSGEDDLIPFDKDALRRFQADESAWSYFARQAPFYRKAATYWVMSAKRAETRERRLGALIASSAAGEAIAVLRRPERRP